MKFTPIIIIACVVGVALLVFLARKRFRIAPTFSVMSHDIPEIISQLGRSSENGNFALLMFVPPGSADGEAVNLQYSIENGTVGMDWVLLGSRNAADRAEIVQFASKLGNRLDEHEMNGVRYLRVTGSGIAELGSKIIQDFYRISSDTELEMVTEGFQWQPQQGAEA
jgi:hypothetical protein